MTKAESLKAYFERQRDTHAKRMQSARLVCDYETAAKLFSHYDRMCRMFVEREAA